MIIGLDIGGTNIDTVLIGEQGIVKQIKQPYKNERLIADIISTLQKILNEIEPGEIEKIVLSTTITTNAIVLNQYQKVGLLLEPGPGRRLKFKSEKMQPYFVSGYIDHRGREKEQLNRSELAEARDYFREQKIHYGAVVGKFSTRNPGHENEIAEYFSDEFDRFFVGHALSGELNYPRRIYTAFLNTAVFKINQQFVETVNAVLERLGLRVPVFVLKADGGSMLLEESLSNPVETILSGPAASIMGGAAFAPPGKDLVVIDIGGTTTDISFFAGREPLFETRGVEINGFKTLVKGLYSRSFGLGGDSLVKFAGDQINIGPDRVRPAIFGGEGPTPSDALHLLGRLKTGHTNRALQVLNSPAAQLGLEPGELAERIIRQLAEKIAEKVDSCLQEVNSRPVYTIHQLLEGKLVKPVQAVIIGGPARALKSYLQEKLGVDVFVPPYYQVANALGAALSRVTAELSLIADTEEGYYLAGGRKEEITGDFSLQRAREIVFNSLMQQARKLGYGQGWDQLYIAEEEKFNLVQGFYTAGHYYRIKARLKPGLEEGALAWLKK